MQHYLPIPEYTAVDVEWDGILQEGCHGKKPVMVLGPLPEQFLLALDEVDPNATVPVVRTEHQGARFESAPEAVQILVLDVRPGQDFDAGILK